jgi:hypothetical protein
MSDIWCVKLDARHREAFEQLSRNTRRSPADEVRYALDRFLAARALKQSQSQQAAV